MSEFDDREKGFERKYEIEQELKFKTAMRSAKMTAKWAAAKLGLQGGDVDEYVKEVLDVDVMAPRNSELVNKIEGDFTAKKIPVSRSEIAAQVGVDLAKAQQELSGSK